MGTLMTDALDLCAGIGWAAAGSEAGISEEGVDTMPEVAQTRKVMGLETTQRSIADLPDEYGKGFRIHIGGPPCQPFSMAGSGSGRAALGEVLRRAEHFRVTGDLIRSDGDDIDPRTWLVLEPLRLAMYGQPDYVVWEQVPSVLPVWSVCRDIFTEAGYSAWSGIIDAERYGVPQTRKRAFLIARKDGKTAGPPPVTHSKYYNRTPGKLDPGVLKWVSMAEALGWGVTIRPAFTVTGGGTETGGAEPFGHGDRTALLEYRASTMPNATRRNLDQPAPTVAFGNDMASVKWVYRGSNQAHAARRPLDTPAPTVNLAERSNKVEWMPEDTAPDPAASGIRVTVEEAAALQTFPEPERIQGKQGKRYLQVGNMVPPMLGAQILREFL